MIGLLSLSFFFGFSSSKAVASSPPLGIVQACDASGSLYPSGTVSCTLNNVQPNDALIVLSFGYGNGAGISAATVLGQSNSELVSSFSCSNYNQFQSCSDPSPQTIMQSFIEIVWSNQGGGNLVASTSASGGSGGIGAISASIFFYELAGPLLSSDSIQTCENNGQVFGITLQNGCSTNFVGQDTIVFSILSSNSITSFPAGWNVEFPNNGAYTAYPWSSSADFRATSQVSSSSQYTASAAGIQVDSGFPTFETAWNIPDSQGLTSSILFLLFALLPIGIFETILMKTKSKESYVLFLLLGLLLGSVFGVIANVVPVSTVLVFGTVFVVYMWRGRNKNGNNLS